MDEITKALVIVLAYRLPELIKQLRILLFGVIDRIQNNQDK